MGIGKHSRLILSLLGLAYLILCVMAAMEFPPWLHTGIVHFFVVLAIIFVMRQLFLLFSIIGSNWNPPPLPPTQHGQPFVSIIVPAFNEEEVIEPALASLLALDYSNYEILVIDDGSTDATADRAHHIALTKNPKKIKVQIISQTNAGKANALNTGIIHAAGELLLCVDADAQIDPNSLQTGLRHFQNPRIGAVAGNVMVSNTNCWLTQLQQLEYLIGQNFVRRGLSRFGAVTIVPGPIGLFRRSAIARVHGYREDTKLFAEDADLSVRLLGDNWLIVGDAAMKAYTEAPNSLFNLLRQRYRWKRGIYQVFHDNFFALLTAPGLRRPLIALMLLTESFLLELLAFGITLFALVNILYFMQINLLLGWLTLLFALDVIVLMIATSPPQWVHWLPLLILQRLTYSYVLQIWGVLALFDEWRSHHMSWDKLNRLGSLQTVGTKA